MGFIERLGYGVAAEPFVDSRQRVQRFGIIGMILSQLPPADLLRLQGKLLAFFKPAHRFVEQGQVV